MNLSATSTSITPASTLQIEYPFFPALFGLSAQLLTIYGLQSSGNYNLAQERMELLNQNYLGKHVDLVNNKLKDHEIQKMCKAHKTRVKRSSAGLDANKIEEYHC